MDTMLTAEQLAEKVTYQGSGEHKRFPNPLCDPHLRSDASDCDAVDPTLSQEPERLLSVLREAFRRGQHDRLREGGFPRKAWGWIRIQGGEQALFEARLTNSATGVYKGYFITVDDLIGKLAWVRRHVIKGGSWSEVLG